MNNFSKLALGTWLMGGTKDPDPHNDDNHDIKVIQTAIENGITLIDTAQNYAAGKCEELVGKAVKECPRESYQVLTKQIKSELTYDEVIKGCKLSLARLELEYLDYFVCHAPSLDVDMREFFKAANQLHKDGIIRNVGVSNFGPKALKIAVETSDLPISLNQVCFSLSDYDIITTGTYDFCLKYNIPIQAYRTLVDLKDNEKLSGLLLEVSSKYNITSQQLAIAYLNSFENMHFTVRASSKEHWQQLKEALKVKIDDNDAKRLRTFHEKQEGTRRHFLEI